MACSNAEAGPRRAPFHPPRRVEGIQNPSERNQNHPEQNQSPGERNPNPPERNPNLFSFHESSFFNGLSPTLTGSPLKRLFCRPPRRRDAHPPQPEQTLNNRFTRPSRKCRFFRKHRGATWAPRRTTGRTPGIGSTETQCLTQTPVVQILTFGLRTPVAGRTAPDPLLPFKIGITNGRKGLDSGSWRPCHCHTSWRRSSR
jgi:hypothetical protein